jgi:hypothetical protein
MRLKQALTAQYYAQQGYTPEQIAAATASYGYDSPSYASASTSTAASSGAGAVYGAGIPGAFQTISVTPAASSAASGSAPAKEPKILNRQVFDTDIINQSSIYEPGATQQLVKEGRHRLPPGKRETVIRKGNGRTWEDPTLLDWDPSEPIPPYSLNKPGKQGRVNDLQSGSGCSSATCPTTSTSES